MPSAKDSGGATALFIASQNGHLATVRFLLDHRAQVDLALHTNATPLYVSCQNGHLQVAEILLAFGAVPNSQTDDEATPLFIAAQMGHFGIVKKLLEFNGDIKLANRTKATPLFIAAQKPGFHSTFFDLLWWFWNFWQVMAWDVFASMLCKPPPHTFRQVWSVWSGFSTLHRGYFPGWVKWVSQSGWIWLDLTLNHSEEWSRWHRHVSTSCWFRHQRLHQWWCIPNLHCCAKRLHESAGIVDGAPGVDANLSANDGATPILIAAQNGHQEAVRFLLKKKVDVTKAMKSGATALFVAAQNGYLEVVQDLVAARAGMV